MKKMYASLIFSLVNVLLYAQDKGGLKIEIKREPDWYSNPLVWVAGGAVFILILVAILRGRRSN